MKRHTPAAQRNCAQIPNESLGRDFLRARNKGRETPFVSVEVAALNVLIDVPVEIHAAVL